MIRPILGRQRWTRQPSHAARVSMPSWARPPVSVLTMTGGLMREAMPGPGNPTIVSAVTQSADVGATLKFDGTDDYLSHTRPSSITSSSAWALMMHMRFSGGILALRGFFYLGDAGVGYWWDQGNGMLIATAPGDTDHTTELAIDPDVRAFHRWFFVNRGSGHPEIWCDGRNIAANGTAGLSLEASQVYELGRGAFQGFFSNTEVESAVLFDYAPSEAEIKALTSQPASAWSIYEPLTYILPTQIPTPILGPALHVATTGMSW